MQPRRETSTCGLVRRRTVGVIGSLLCLTLTLPFLWHISISKQEEDESDKRLSRVVRSLNSIQVDREQKLERQHSQATSTIIQKFPWLVQNNTLKNYFHGGGTQSVDVYSDSAVVFLHQHRSAGQAIKECLVDIAHARKLVKAPSLTSDDRLKWDTGEKGYHNDINKEGIKFHQGQYAFGLCNSFDRKPCSYFTILREPMERAKSSHEYCKTAMAHEMCKVINANEVTLRDWILHHGSLTFQQLVFSSDWCKSQPMRTHQNSQSLLKPEEYPCWYKHKLHLDSLTKVEKQHLLDYVLEHLEQWFSLIGLVEDFDSSVEMLEAVYRLPFSKCASIKRYSSNNAGINDNRANRKRRRSEYTDEEDAEYLIYDYEVQNALEMDYKIYKKAKQLYHIQKQVFKNKLTS